MKKMKLEEVSNALVIIDLDTIIVDLEDIHKKANQRLANSVEVEYTDELHKRCFGTDAFTTANIIAEGKNFDMQSLSVDKERYLIEGLLENESSLKPKPVRELFEKFLDNDNLLVIISHSISYTLIFDLINLDGLNNAATSFSEVNAITIYGKLQRICKSNAIAPEEALLITGAQALADYGIIAKLKVAFVGDDSGNDEVYNFSNWEELLK